MKVLFNTHTPFNLTHGGMQVQIECTKAALGQIGVETDWFKWWEEHQSADILHQVGSIPVPMIRAARRKGWKVIQCLLLTEVCNRSYWELFIRQMGVRSALAFPFPDSWRSSLRWRDCHECDLNVVGLEAERMVLEKVYGVPRERIAVVPLGLGDRFLNVGLPTRSEPHLVCTGTIAPVKNSLELARLAHRAEVPLLFIGKPFDYASPYWKEFAKLIDGRFVRHQPHVPNEELIPWLQRARGYVLMSRNENWSLAAHEAAACGLPMLVPDQRWSRERFGSQAAYFPRPHTTDPAEALRAFYESCPKLPSPNIKQFSWREVGEQLQRIYQKLLN